MHFEAIMKEVWRCAQSPGLNKVKDALGGCDRASSEIHLEVMMEQAL